MSETHNPRFGAVRFVSGNTWMLSFTRLSKKNKDARSLGFVRTIDSNEAAEHRLKQRLSEQDQIPDGVNVFADGDPGLRGILMSALPKANRHDPFQ